MKLSGRIRLGDLRPLSQEEHEQARLICAEIEELVKSRSDYVREHQLDPEIADPGANWAKNADNAIHNLYNLVARAEYDVLNRLRLYTQPFTGYQLARMALGFRKIPIPSPNDAFDCELDRLAPTPDHWIERYQVITRQVPEDIIARFPLRLGEIGWNIGGAPVNHDVYSLSLIHI